MTSKNMKESFVRSGKVEEWKEYSTDDIKMIEKLLNKENISLHDFILEEEGRLCTILFK